MFINRLKWKLRPIKRFLMDDAAVYLQTKDKKSISEQFRDIYGLYKRFNYIPYHYFKTPLCTKYSPRDVSKYIPPKLIERALPTLNYLRTHEEGRRLADKAIFGQIMTQHGIPCIKTLAVTDEAGNLLDPMGLPIDEAQLRAAAAPFKGKVFMKPLKGSGGAGVQAIDLENSSIEVLTLDQEYVIQPLLIQHPAMDALFAHCVNTIRIDTFLQTGVFLHNAAVVRIGTGQSLADNWNLGAIAVGINLDSGTLMKVGWKKNKFGHQGGFLEHPDSGVRFEGYQIPFWDEIKRLVCTAAEVAQPCKSLGWDVAITPTGPVVIETNVLWDVNLMQTAWGGLAYTPIALHVLSQANSKVGTTLQQE